jgi:hypothetical protein
MKISGRPVLPATLDATTDAPSARSEKGEKGEKGEGIEGVGSTAPAAAIEGAPALVTVVAPVASAAASTGDRRIGNATVVGGGPAGLAQAILLLKRAPEVGISRLTVVERREEYTRPVGLFFRAMTLDALVWLDEPAFRELERRAGMRGLDGSPRGFLAQKLDASGKVISQTPRERDEASAARFARTALDPKRPIAAVADELFADSSVALLTMKDLEEVMWDALPRLAARSGVTLDLRRSWEAEIVEGDGEPCAACVVLHELAARSESDKRLARTGKAESLPAQGLVVLTEGAAGRLRGRLASTHVLSTGPSEKILAGSLQGAPEGASLSRGCIASFTDEDGREHPVRVMRGCNGKNGVHWTVVGVPPPVVMDPTDATTHKRDVDEWFARYGGITGPMDLPVTFGPNLGEVKGTLVDKAVRGENLVLCGDVVGTSHFSAGGGAATAVTTHVAAMSRFLDEVARGAPRQASLQKLDEDLRAASLTWALYGLPEFVGDPFALRQRYLPRALLEELLPPAYVARYWPVGGGAPTDEKSPWTAWFQERASADEEKAVCQVPPVKGDGLKARLDQAARADRALPHAAEPPVTAQAWAAVLAPTSPAAPASSGP